MEEHKAEQIQAVFAMMDKYNYEKNETANRRVRCYDFRENTKILQCDTYIKIRTETDIAGVYNVLTICCDGSTKWSFEVNGNVIEA